MMLAKLNICSVQYKFIQLAIAITMISNKCSEDFSRIFALTELFTQKKTKVENSVGCCHD